MTAVKTRKKLIEVALPLQAINAACVLEKQPFTRGHPRSLHVWWARRPLAAARAVIFAQMVDDPSAQPDIFPTAEKQERERQRLFRIIEELVKWENTNNDVVLEAAQDEIWQSWRAACAENADHPRAKELFNRHVLPAFHDPFAGGGALPLEAQRLGLETYASDLNPVAVLICKAITEIPPKFAGNPPVNPEARKDRRMFAREWRGAAGLADDVRYYGKWMRDEAVKRIGHLYPRVEITPETAEDRPELKSLIGRKLAVVAWLWARTVKSPNPAFRNVDVPLVADFMLSTKPGKEAYVEPVIEGNGYRFVVKIGKPRDPKLTESGTKPAGRGSTFECLISKTPIDGKYIKSEGQAGRIGARLMAIVAEDDKQRIYLAPTGEMEATAHEENPPWKPEQELTGKSADQLPLYGMRQYWQLFTRRQLVALTTFSDLVAEARQLVREHAILAGLPDDDDGIDAGGMGAFAYAEAIAVYLAMATSRWSDLSNTICTWNHTNQNVRALFARQAIPMSWDFVELSPFSRLAPWYSMVESSAGAQASLAPGPKGYACQLDATTQNVSVNHVVSTDPPYYDNICYADLSDFFYVWLRHPLRSVFPNLMATLATPKIEELIAASYRHGGRKQAESFFLEGMTNAMSRLAEHPHPAFPVTIYYAFKQSETEDQGTASSGWETFLDAVIRAGLTLTGTWPMRTERESRSVGLRTNALASSIILACRPRLQDAGTTTRREFMSRLKAELPAALSHLQRGNIAPVDLEQAAIGPGMAIYSSYAKVVDAEGKSVSVRDALRLINRTLYEVLAEQEGDFDSDTRWALVWFEQHGFAEGDYGTAEQLSKSKNTSVEGMVRAGILVARGGRVRLLRPSELTADWEPERDSRLTVWEITHQLIRVLQGGEPMAAELLARLGSKAEIARELAYRLYTVCERKKRSADAALYNGLVKSWPEIVRLAQEEVRGRPQQGQMI